MKLRKVLALAISMSPGWAFAQANLENPANGATESGIGIISGWHCTASTIEVVIDGVSRGNTYTGSRRADTVGICGRLENGFSMLINFNNLNPGAHNIKVYGDGVLFADYNFNTVRSGGVPFLQGLSRQIQVPDFPAPGQTTSLQWSEARQTFVVVGAANQPPVSDISVLTGSYTGMISSSLIGSACNYYDLFYGVSPARYGVTTSGSSAVIIGYTQTDACTFNLTKTGGDATNGFNFSGSNSCASGIQGASVSARGIRKSGGKLLGTVDTVFPGCTQRLVLY